MISITMPYTGDVSNNHYYGRRRNGGVFILESARLWGLVLRGAINSCLDTHFSPDSLDKTHPFDLMLVVHFPRRFNKRSGDATNFDKFTRDVVAETLGIDDVGTSFLPGSPQATYGNGGQARIIVGIQTYGEVDLMGEVCLS